MARALVQRASGARRPAFILRRHLKLAQFLGHAELLRENRAANAQRQRDETPRNP
jgi:hypothetical protein